MIGDDVVRAQVLELLRGGNAYMTLDEAVADYPMASINTSIPNGTYSPWHLLEHMRLAQEDILEFMTSSGYVERRWPQDYWPAADATATAEQWQQTIDRIRAVGPGSSRWCRSRRGPRPAHTLGHRADDAARVSPGGGPQRLSRG